MGTTPICSFCGRPVLGHPVWGHSGEPYHRECTHGPSGPLRYEPRPPSLGAYPVTVLTESDVRRIVQEELAKLRHRREG